MLKITKLTPKFNLVKNVAMAKPAYSKFSIAASADADDGVDGVDKTKAIVGVGMAVMITAALALVYTRKSSSAVPNRSKKYKTSLKKREYMKGYRAGRKFCG